MTKYPESKQANGYLYNTDNQERPGKPMPESEDPKDPEKVTNNDLRNSQFGGGFINAENVSAGRIGGDIRNIKKFIFNFIFGQQLAPVGNPARPKNQRQLLAQVSNEVESRISHSLHNRIYIRQDTDQNPSQIELPWASEIKVGSKPKVHLINTEITAIYDQPDIAGRLLILGKPGVGKTTMLLKLAEELVNRAKNDPAHPIPVLFSLSSWKNDNQIITDWLVDQLKDKYGVRKDIGKQLVNNQEIIPLLDGLDELAAKRQEKCVIKINDFLHSGWSNSLVICSRIEEYQLYKSLLQLNNSLELRSFTSQQVHQYLEKTENLHFWDSIGQNKDLKQLAQTPLFLNIIVISAQEISIKTWQQFQSSEERLSYLFDAYILRMLQRSYRGKRLKQENIKRWLGWLAQRLIEEKKTEFFIEKLQPFSLKKTGEKRRYKSIVNMVSGLFNGLFYWVILRLFDKQFSGLIFALIFGLISGLSEGWVEDCEKNEINIQGYEIETYETLKNPKDYTTLKKMILWMIIGMIVGLISEVVGGLIYGLIFGVNLGVIGGFQVLKGAEVENKNFPNYGIKKSIEYTAILVIILTFLGLAISYVIYKLPLLEDKRFLIMLCLSLPILLGTPTIGQPVIRHLSLRLVLSVSGYMPWNYAKFLDYCTNRLFLQKVGGGYRFMHDLLRQHFATYYSPTKNEQSVQASTQEY